MADIFLYSLIVTADAKAIADVAIGVMAFLAVFLPFVLIPVALKNADQRLHQVWRGGVNGLNSVGNKAGNLAKRGLGAAKEEAQGRLAQQYDTSKPGYRGKNLGIRLATGNVMPGRASTRKVVAKGLAYQEGITKDAQAQLRQTGLSGNPRALATLAAGGEVTTSSGGKVNSRTSPELQRAAVQALISSKSGEGLEQLMQSQHANWAMIEDEVGQKYGDVKGVGAHLAKAAGINRKRSEFGKGPLSRADMDQLALTETAGLSYEQLATQAPETLQAAARAQQKFRGGGYKFAYDDSNKNAGETDAAFYTRLAKDVAKVDPQKIGEDAVSFQTRVKAKIEADVQAADVTVSKNAGLALSNEQVARTIKTPALPALEVLRGSATTTPTTPAVTTSPTPGPAAVAPAPTPTSVPPTPSTPPPPTVTGGGGTLTINHAASYEPVATRAYGGEDLRDIIGQPSSGAGPSVIRSMIESSGGIAGLSNADLARFHSAAQDSLRDAPTLAPTPASDRDRQANRYRQQLEALSADIDAERNRRRTEQINTQAATPIPSTDPHIGDAGPATRPVENFNPAAGPNFSSPQTREAFGPPPPSQPRTSWSRREPGVPYGRNDDDTSSGPTP